MVRANIEPKPKIKGLIIEVMPGCPMTDEEPMSMPSRGTIVKKLIFPVK